MLEPLRRKRDMLAAELIEDHGVNDADLKPLIEKAISGNAEHFRGFYCDDECPHCGSSHEEWRTDTHAEFYYACVDVASAEDKELKKLLHKD